MAATATQPARKGAGGNNAPIPASLGNWSPIPDVVITRGRSVCTTPEFCMVIDLYHLTVGKWQQGRPESAAIPMSVLMERAHTTEENTVRRIIRSLQDKGLIEVQERPGKPSLYRCITQAFHDAEERAQREREKLPVEVKSGQRISLVPGQRYRGTTSKPFQGYEVVADEPGELQVSEGEMLGLRITRAKTDDSPKPAAVDPPLNRGGLTRVTAAEVKAALLATFKHHFHKIPDDQLTGQIAGILHKATLPQYMAVVSKRLERPRGIQPGLFIAMARDAEAAAEAAPAPPKQQREAAPVSFDTEPENSGSIWAKMLVDIARQITPVEFKNWFKLTAFSAFKDGELVVRIADKMSAKFIDEEYGDIVHFVCEQHGVDMIRWMPPETEDAE